MDVNQVTFGVRDRKIGCVILQQTNLFTLALQVLDRIEFDFSIKKVFEKVRRELWFFVANFVSFGFILIT